MKIQSDLRAGSSFTNAGIVDIDTGRSEDTGVVDIDTGQTATAPSTDD